MKRRLRRWRGAIAQRVRTAGRLVPRVMEDADTWVIGGLLIMGVGLYAVHPPLAAVVVGGLVFAIGAWMLGFPGAGRGD